MLRIKLNCFFEEVLSFLLFVLEKSSDRHLIQNIVLLAHKWLCHFVIAFVEELTVFLYQEVSDRS